ncbi:hypothetical protein GWK47_010004 [Chionoecetes opilio]|uniref:Uncharacterized protein n=1 Tax=Chionoecetes opilio TaxID=41210 RepID=A0A8J5CQK5_CHIOP|nr:hypothetical protein GWK47_010004 [Chionoecetes opilio]
MKKKGDERRKGVEEGRDDGRKRKKEGKEMKEGKGDEEGKEIRKEKEVKEGEEVSEEGFVIYLEGFVIYLEGFVIYLEGFVTYLEGFVIYLQGFVIYLEGFVIYLEGFVIYLEGFVIYLEGFVIYLEDFVIYLEGFVIYLEGFVIYLEGFVIYLENTATNSPLPHVCTNSPCLFHSMPPCSHNDLAWNIRNFVHNKLEKVDMSQNLSTVEPWGSSPWSHTDLARLRHGRVGAQQKKRFSRDRQQGQKTSLEHLSTILPPDTVRKIHIAQETGASNWLTSLPIRAKGFNLNKQKFVDAVALRYGWPVEGLPNTCVCGSPNNVDHTMKCKKGGFVCIRHDEVRDLTASMLREVCQDVSTEPTLLPLDGELLRYRTANTAPEARVDICARGFWTRGSGPFWTSGSSTRWPLPIVSFSLEAVHHRNELEKIRAYGDRILQVDHGTFTPLVFTTSGGMAPKARSFYSRLADLMSVKKHQPRSSVAAG